MLVKNLAGFPFGTKVTSRKPPQPELMLAVRGRFRFVHGGVMEMDVAPDHDSAMPDLATQGSLSMEIYAEDDEEQLGAPQCPNDLVDFKLRGEVMVRGTCHVPSAEPMQRTTVGVTVSGGAGTLVSKRLDVVGPRVWSDRLVGAQMSDPLPFSEMLVSYENAFGGEGFALNPAGKGMVGNELPTIETPSQPIRAPGDQPPPGGFGPLNPEWPQRASARGKNYGSDWEKKRAPFYSDDFDWRYFQCAPADQQIKGYFAGDEELALENLHPEHRVLKTRLPSLTVRVFIKRDRGDAQEVKMVLDTIFVDADEQAAFLTWRGLTDVREIDRDDVVALLIASDPAGEPAPAEDYIAQLEAFIEDPIQLEGIDKAALEAQREEGMARLEASMEALDELGEGGDAEFGNNLARLVDVASGDQDPERTAAITGAMTELDSAKGKAAENDVALPSIGDSLQEVSQRKAKQDPAPLKIPDGDAMSARPMPDVVAALEDARDKALAAEAEAKGALDQAGDAGKIAPDILLSLKRHETSSAFLALARSRFTPSKSD